MKHIHPLKYLILLMPLCWLLSACPSNSGIESNNGQSSTDTKPGDKGYVGKRAGINEVIIHELGDPDKLNVITSTSAGATYIKYNIFMYLLDVNKETLELNPSLAVRRPQITELTDGEYAGGLRIDYEIRPEAVWDNGQPVTGYDVLFTFKAIKNPLVDAEPLRPYIDFITDIKIDPDNPKKFSMFCNKKYFAAETSSGFQAFIAPEYICDPKGLMKKFKLKDLSDPQKLETLRNEPNMIAFANDFNSEKFQRNPDFVVGCGPYRLIEWTTGQRIILEKKKNWWGDQLADKAVNFKAFPEKLIYEIITDQTTALTALKDEGIDISRALRPKDFDDLQQDNSFRKKFYMPTPTSLSYTYIGINMKNSKLSDVRVREALAHLVDIHRIIDVLLYGLAEPTIGPIHPSKPYYDKDIQPFEFDINKARDLLEQAGWNDSDGDGIRDKNINGVKTSLNLTYKFNTGNDTREKIGLFLKENAHKIGVNIEIVPKEWTVYLDELKNHNFELCCLGWVQDPLEDDPKQIWYTKSYNGGSNYVGFGNEKTDKLIENLRSEMDEQKRDGMYKELQEEIHRQIPYIFLYTPKERLVISKRFENVKTYIARPGYTERELKVRNADDSAI